MMQKMGHLDSDKDLDVLSPLLTYAEAARYLRKGQPFVRRAVYAGDLAVSRIGRTPYIHDAATSQLPSRGGDAGTI